RPAPGSHRDARRSGRGAQGGRRRRRGRQVVAQPALQLWNVGKSYGAWRKREALRGVSISVAPGECYGLAGPNGAGKTTLIRVLLGLSAPDEGEVRPFGARPDDPEVRRRVGFVPASAELPQSTAPRARAQPLRAPRGL